MLKRAQQLELPTWGGRRKGAGRKRRGRIRRVSHKQRPPFFSPTAVLVTLAIVPEGWNLRSQRCFRVIAACFAAALGRFGLRLIHFSVLGNHLHLIVEADDSEALSRGMQGLNIRLARALNRVMRRSGRLFADHYHSRLLQTPTELVNAIAYVLGNHVHHYGGSGPDRYSSAVESAQPLLCQPQSWLLRTGWRRAKRIPHWMTR
jgi:REP element-mobilizing transposase RayT